MHWTHSIRQIIKAQENNQLVIFVGAGVSKNSAVPGWSELIRIFADKLNYCQDDSGRMPGTYTQEEMLRIPEYYFHKDTSENHADYYRLIQETLCCDSGSNPVDDIIFRILPHHIITTNYDSLLEASSMVNVRLYAVVRQDSDLLSQTGDRYLIKMHGDLNLPQSIVLKESDYLEYEQRHPLISTFIRSLLVNHTFLFVGYSLNDYNLNLIIGWINYFSKYYGVGARPMNVLVTTDEPSEFDRDRLAHNNISIVSLSALPEDLPAKAAVPSSLSHTAGQKLYSFLKCVLEPRLLEDYIPLSELLAEKYQTLKSYRKISFWDFIKVCPLGQTKFMSTELVFYDQEWYDRVAGLLDSGNPEILDAFRRAGLTAIHCADDDQSRPVPGVSEQYEELFQLYLDNDFGKLLTRTAASGNISAQIYYARFFGIGDSEISDLIAKEAAAAKSEDYISILLHKTRARLALLHFYSPQEERASELHQLFSTAPAKYADALGRLRSIFESSANDMRKMEALLEKQEKRYEFSSHTWHSGHSFIHLWELQAYAYDYYFFFKENFLPFDGFSDPENYLSCYLKAILCSYSPAAFKAPEPDIILKTDRRPWPLTEIDLDMFIKYMPPKALKSALNNYSVQSLKTDGSFDIMRKYQNLCAGYSHFHNRSWAKYMFSFHILLCRLEMEEADRAELLRCFVSMLRETADSCPGMIEDLFEPLEYLVQNFKTFCADQSGNLFNRLYGDLLDGLLLPQVRTAVEAMHSTGLSRILRILAPYRKPETVARIMTEIDTAGSDEQKIRIIAQLWTLLPAEQYTDFLTRHMRLLRTDDLFRLTVGKIIPFSSSVFQLFLQIIAQEGKQRKKAAGMRTYPDHLAACINYCIILKLLGFDIDISALAPYAKYSKCLQFILDPERFDYSQVDTAYYMWQNLIWSREYQSYFVKHSRELLSEDLKKLFKMGTETRAQQKVVYGLLLDEEDLQDFPD